MFLSELQGGGMFAVFETLPLFTDKCLKVGLRQLGGDSDSGRCLWLVALALLRSGNGSGTFLNGV